MHGTKQDRQLPMYGSKGIGIQHGRLEMHGKPRDFTWTMLSTTAEAGATEITLMDAVDWVIGEELVIASTDFDMNQAETRHITAVSLNRKTLTLDKPLKYLHYSAVETYGDHQFPMRAEVGLLTRNVKY